MSMKTIIPDLKNLVRNTEDVFLKLNKGQKLTKDERMTIVSFYLEINSIAMTNNRPDEDYDVRLPNGDRYPGSDPLK